MDSQSPASSSIQRYALTLISAEIHPEPLSRVTQLLSRNLLNIDAIRRLSEPQGSGFNAHCLEISLSSRRAFDLHLFRKQLFECAKELGIDLAFQPENLYRRLKRLVVLDMDSTLIQNEVIDELAKTHGVFAEVSQITAQAMQGRLDYDESLQQRCLKLKGLPAQALIDVVSQVQLTPGAQEMVQVLKRIGIKIALISGSFLPIAESFRKKLGLDHAYANQLEIENGRLTGRVIPPIVNAARKAKLLETIAAQEGISLQQAIAVGDGANDLLMLETAGLGVAFNAKPVVGERADLCIDTHDLRSILHLLGLTSAEIAEALIPA